MRLIQRILAVLGTVLVWAPLLATVVTSLIGSIESGTLLFDFLMPAELFPVALAGGGLLLAAALLVRKQRALVAWSLGIALAALAGSQGLAVVTGLASGATRPEGLPWVSVIALIALYALALIALGVGGVRLLGDVLPRRRA